MLRPSGRERGRGRPKGDQTMHICDAPKGARKPTVKSNTIARIIDAQSQQGQQGTTCGKTVAEGQRKKLKDIKEPVWTSTVELTE